MTVFRATPITPQLDSYYPFSALEYFQVKENSETRDPHKWLAVNQFGGVEIQNQACPIDPTLFDFTCESTTEKSDPVRAVKEVQTYPAKWAELAVSCSTVGIDEDALEELAHRNLRQAVDLNVALDIGAQLTADAVATTPQPTILCAYAQAVGALAATVGSGIGVIWIKPFEATVLLSTHVLKIVGNRLVDNFGNLVVVNRALGDPNTIYFTNATTVQIYVSEYKDFFFDAASHADATRGWNDRIVRAEVGWIVALDYCGVGSVEYAACG